MLRAKRPTLAQVYAAHKRRPSYKPRSRAALLACNRASYGNGRPWHW